MTTTDKPTTDSPRRDGDDVLDQNLHTLLGQAGDPATIAPAARTRIRATLIARGAVAAQAPRSRVTMVGWGLALSAAGAVAIAAIIGVGHGPGPGSGAAPVAVGVGADGPNAPSTTLTLADGSIAELGDGGSLRELGPRRVRITGKVFLDVVPGQGTFTVDTAAGELTVLGTRFVVEADADQTVASVLRGAVAMRSSGGEEIIHAGEEGTMTAHARPVRRPAPRLSHLVSWVAERRRKDERPPALPARSGVLIARNPIFQDQEFPLPLRALTVDVHLENQVARVALDQTFFNPQPQQLEGVYKFALPPDAAVARLAMYVDGHLNESAVVERMAARRIYEDVVYQRRDPALLEQQGAAKVSLRIFPLPPQQDKRVILAYTQPLARTYDDVTLTVPLPELETPVADIDLHVKVVGCGGCELASPSHAITVERTGADATVSYRAHGEKLGDSLILRIRQPGAPAATAATAISDGKRYLLVRTRPDLGAAVAPADRPHRWIVLDDTSASRGVTERRAQAELIDHLVQEIDEHDQVMVIAFDATHRRFGAWQDAMAIDRPALARFLAADGGLGETDLAEALAGATKLLDGDAGYVVYVGDGTATGERRTIDQLRDALAGGRATFIGLGVGDGVDLPTLDALADASGGLATHVDLGDDLAWRALDVVAALYTPRLTGLVASVSTAGATAGQPGDAERVMPYLRSRQVAAGEDVELVVQAPVRDDLTAVTVRGLLAGQPWQRTYAVADLARAPGDAGYLPRLWAERRLEALVTAGDRALAPCTTTPCASDEDRAIAAYHARKDEMVALGRAHFLLSQHTSLLVLENDAMYRQYGVSKGSGLTWAPYVTPATVAVAPVSAPITDDGPLWRWPASMVSGNGIVATATVIRDANKDFESAGFALGGTIGLGKLGTVGHAAGVGDAPMTGTGQGYGMSGATRGGGGNAAAGPTVPMAEPAEDRASADVDDADPTAAVEAKKSNADWGEASNLATGTEALEQQPIASHTVDYKAGAEEGDATGLYGDGAGRSGLLARRGSRERFDDALDNGVSDLSPEQGLAMSLAYYSSTDWRLDDLTAWLPGLARTSYDDLADELDDAAGADTGSITDDARRALATARTTLRPGRWRWDQGAEVVVDGAGRIQRSRTLDTGVREVLTADGATLTTSYPDLGLAAIRLVGDHEPALLGTLVPLLPPRPEHLARWYTVTLSGTRTIRLAPARGAGAITELDLADDGTIAAARRIVDGTATTVMTAIRAGAGFDVTAGGRTIAVEYHVDDTLTVASAAPADVTIDLPLRADGHWRRVLDGQAAAAPGWRRLEHQRAAAALATGNLGVLAQVARELAAAGALATAERVLVGGAVTWLDPTSRSALTGGGGAIADYFTAAIALRDGRTKGVTSFADLATRSDGLVATLAAHRSLLQAIERGSYPAARAAFDRVLDRHPSELLGMVAARRLAQTFYWQNPDAITALDRVAVGRWRNQARLEAAQFAGYVRGYGRTARPDAGDRWVALLEDVELSAPPPAIDGNARAQVVASARGEVGWNLAMAAWKQRVLAAGDYDHVMAFARAARLGPSDDVDAALDRALTLAGDDADALHGVVIEAFAAGRVDRARTLLTTARARQPRSAPLILLASQFAEQQGDYPEAARLLTESMKAEGDGPVALSALRVEYGRLIRLYAGSAKAATGPARDQAVDAALAAGRDWRALDPDAAGRERQLGELLFAVGRDDEGWRYLSTPIDLAPREGPSFQGAAEVLESQGKLERALGLWRRAFAIDATNPTWLMRAAQVELALGRTADAQATIARINDRTWHNRFWSVTSWAQNAKAARSR